jgi:hypothetical protein
MGLSVCIALGMLILAIKLGWHLRKHAWFWTIVAFILALHVTLVLMIRWPRGNGPTLLYTMPLGILDFLIVSAAFVMGEKLLLRNSSCPGMKHA